MGKPAHRIIGLSPAAYYAASRVNDLQPGPNEGPQGVDPVCVRVQTAAR
jgi:hypothetical protein